MPRRINADMTQAHAIADSTLDPAALPDFAVANEAYEAMSALLRQIGDIWPAHLRLEDLAAAAGLSATQAHKLFRRWTGTTPRRLAHAYSFVAAQAAMNDGADLLEAADQAGLSGPSRLHDLFIAEERVTPGEAKRRGDGLDFRWGVAETPFGIGVFLIAPRGLSGLAFAANDPAAIEAACADLLGRFPAANMLHDPLLAQSWRDRIFGPTGARLALALYGTDWQRQVWRALLRLKPGEVSVYRAIAAEVCTVKAARAVGAAIGANPISWLIPCHRVLASDRRLTGYHWGVERKRAMLAWEAFSDR